MAGVMTFTLPLHPYSVDFIRTEPGAQHLGPYESADSLSTADVTPTPRVGGALFPINDNSRSDHAERLGVGGGDATVHNHADSREGSRNHG